MPVKKRETAAATATATAPAAVTSTKATSRGVVGETKPKLTWNKQRDAAVVAVLLGREHNAEEAAEFLAGTDAFAGPALLTAAKIRVRAGKLRKLLKAAGKDLPTFAKHRTGVNVDDLVAMFEDDGDEDEDEGDEDES